MFVQTAKPYAHVNYFSNLTALLKLFIENDKELRFFFIMAAKPFSPAKWMATSTSVLTCSFLFLRHLEAATLFLSLLILLLSCSSAVTYQEKGVQKSTNCLFIKGENPELVSKPVYYKRSNYDKGKQAAWASATEETT